MCISSAIVAILQCADEMPSSAQLCKFGNIINVMKGRKASNSISKGEFVSYCSEYIASCGVANGTINNIILMLSGSLVPIVKEVVKDDD